MKQLNKNQNLFLSIIGILHNLNTSFIISTLGCPNLECQVAKEITLLKSVFVGETQVFILFTQFETKFEVETLGTNFELAKKRY